MLILRLDLPSDVLVSNTTRTTFHGRFKSAVANIKQGGNLVFEERNAQVYEVQVCVC